MIQLTKKKVAELPAITTDSKIEEVAIGKVKLWKNNPRRNDRAVPKLAEIIKARGQITPIVVWRKNMTAYKGNTTLKACKLLEYKTIKVLFADFPSEQSAIAYGIADNKSSEFSAWDDSILEGMLAIENISMFSGFDQIEQNLLIKRMVTNKEKDLTDGLETKNCCPKCGFEF